MKDLGVYLLALTIPFFLVYMLGFLRIDESLSHDLTDTVNEHILLLMHLVNAVIVAMLWNRAYQSQHLPEDVLDDDILPVVENKKGKLLPPLLANILFPIAFLLNLGGLTYLVMFIADNEYPLLQWFTSDLPLFFVVCTTIPASIFGAVLYYRILLERKII